MLNSRHMGQAFFWLLLCSLLILPVLVHAVPAGTVINNTASASFNGGSTVTSNTVTTITVVARTPSNIELLRYAPASGTAQAVPVSITDYSSSGVAAGPFVPMPPPVPAGSATPISLASPVPLDAATMYHQGDPFFVRLTDQDQNLDATTAETVVVTIDVAATGDSEILRLTETGPDTGVFTGYIQSYIGVSHPAAATPANGQLGLQDDIVITASYVDQVDSTDISTTATFVDPFGLVFDSATGLTIDGAQITLIDNASNLPAMVYGDDGISTFPSTITSGGSATDSGGMVYNFGPGEYRFPFVVPGTYRLQVLPPAGYTAPSVVPASVLQTLPGAPYAINDQGSRALPFDVMVGPAIQVDIPLDNGATGFFLVKEVNKRVAAAGDFLQYRLKLTNDTGALAAGTQIVDTLPPGLRYQRGSATVDGNPVADPVISPDGRTLTFSPGDIADGAVTEARYVVEVAIGIRSGDAINSAVASANGSTLVSNRSTASVRIRQDFLRNRNILMGRVLTGGCDAPDDDSARGIAGVRIYLENGSHAVTDDQGMFHVEGVRPGSHVVQMDLETLAPQYEPLVCDEHSRFAGRAFSRFVDLQGGSLWRTDFHVRTLPPPTAEVELAFNSSVEDQLATYHLALHGGDIALDDMRLMVNLPESIRYLPGSSVLDNTSIADPEIRGTVLIYNLGGVPGAWARQLNFLAEVDVKAKAAMLPSKAFLMFNSAGRDKQRTPVAETVMQRIRNEEHHRSDLSTHFDTLSAQLTETDKTELRQLAGKLRKHRVLRIEATGHTDNVPISERSRTLFADNLVLSEARARSVGEYLAKLLDLTDAVLVVNGLGATKPYALNSTESGRARNRRVELHIVTETRPDDSRISDIITESNIAVEVEGEWQGPLPADRKTSSAEVRQVGMPAYDKAWVEAAAPGLQLLWPPGDYNPPIPSIRIAVKHDPAHKLTLLLNDKPVSELNFNTRVKNTAGTVAVSQWAGVDIEKGNNTLIVEVHDAGGRLVERIQRAVRMSSLPVRAELVEDRSRLIADGKQTPVIAVRLYDRDDHPIREGLIGEFMVEPPHTAQQNIDDLQRQPLAGLDRGNARYRVGKDGIALIELKPTTRTGVATLVIPLQQRDATLRPWLQAAQRDWILVGLAEGTVAHNTVSGNMESLSAADLEQDTYTDGKLSFFARGSIRGEWLLTLAYDSDKDTEERNTLFQEIDPDAYYPVYGDKTVQGYDAASREKLYVRLERRQFYALFGDYQTGLTITELARYDRSLTGFKSELRDRYYNLNVFASETGQNFVKDELRGDGTSGLYRLRHPDLVFASEQVSIETRDRFRPQIVLSTRPLTRNVDYNIDYDAGTLFFKRPVPSKDASLNPVFIVVDYETRAAGAEAWTWGGRGAVQLMDNRVEIGATYINQGQNTGDDTLKGVDATIDFTSSMQLKLEYAASQVSNAADRYAYLAELRRTSGTVDGSVYYREQEGGFGLGQQSLIGTGTRLYGMDGRYHLTDRFDFTAQAFRQTDLQTEAERDVVEAGVVYETDSQGASAGLRMARDSHATGATDTSRQLAVGAHRSFLDSHLNLRIDHDQSLSGNANPEYPTRTILGADYLLNPSTTLFVEQELTFGDREDTRGTRIGMNTRPWTGATVNTSLEQRSSEYGPRLFANAGLQQTWQLTDEWSVDTGLDSSTTIRDPGNVPFSLTLPPASGNTEDFTAVSLGATYQAEAWSWTSRIERRTADAEDKWGFYSGAAGEPRQGLGLSARLQLFETQSAAGIEGRQADLRLGLVRRPFGRRWTLLNRTDLAVDSLDGGVSTYDNWKVVNNLLANYRRKANQVSTFYGAKYTRDTIDGVDYSGYTDSFGIEARRDIGKRWDLGARASTLHSWNSDQYEYSFGVSAGFNPATNIWVSAGYNWNGYEDDDFTLAGYTATGPYLRLRFKFDQQTVRQTADWFNRQ
ncbi:MAG: OmpA family protein [Gammaproteobacteria bacterium]